MITSKIIPLGFILNNIKFNILNILLIIFSVWFLDKFIIFPIIPVSIPAFLGTSIALVLGFKLSQSYDRWWEARKIWGAIVNDSRTLIIQIKNFTGGNAQFEILEKIAFRQMGWCHILGKSLRKLPYTTYLEKYIDNSELDEIKNKNNVPLALIDLHAKDIAKLFTLGAINTYQQIQLDKTLVRLCESMGQAERIKNTVFPTTYKLFLHFFIFLFIVFLSISLLESGGYTEIPIMFFLSLPFVLLEMTATLLQDPFENKPTDVSVTAIATTIEINLRDLINNKDFAPTPQNSKSYYVD